MASSKQSGAKKTGSRRRPFRQLRQRHPTFIRGVLLVSVLLFTFVVGLVYAGWALVCRASECPSAEALEDYTPHQTSKLFAADGRFIAEIGGERRTLIKLKDVPKVVQDAFVITEDKRFYSHAGIDWKRVGGAAIHNLRRGGYAQGFSTITMQLARNIFPEAISRQKTLVRKLKEAKVARAIESKFDKAKILELYLNQIYLGSGAYGIETAARRYFGKSAQELNIAEAATLAALPKAPGAYDPRRFPERSIQRRNTVIELMRAEGAISDADANLAKAYPLRLANRIDAGDTAPYFVEWVRQQLDQQYGKNLYEQGLKVYTTLDLDMQSAAERALERQLRAIEGGATGKFAHETYEHYMARNLAGDEQRTNSPYLQGAFIAVDPQTGGIRAMVGGRDFYDSKFNRATQALRQPGSTFKPFVYAAAVQNGRPPSYMVVDSPITVNQVGSEAWSPQNYDLKFEGPMTMRRGLYESRNIIAVRVGMELGENTVINEARAFGITTPILAVPSIFIGAADVYPLEMVAAYTSFANLGIRVAPNAIARVENPKGEILWQPNVAHAQVLTPEESWLMVDMMRDVIQRGTAVGAVWSAGFQYPAGGKTGTTNDGTNVWFIGYTADLVAGVWMGFDQPKKIQSNAQGGRLAAPAWTSFMKEVYRRKPAPPDWPRPDGLINRAIDVTTGQLQSPYCPPSSLATEWYLPGTEPTTQCTRHMYGTDSSMAGRLDSAGGAPVNYDSLRMGDSARYITDSIRRVRIDSLRRARRDSVRRARADSIRKADSIKKANGGGAPDSAKKGDGRAPRPR